MKHKCYGYKSLQDDFQKYFVRREQETVKNSFITYTWSTLDSLMCCQLGNCSTYVASLEYWAGEIPMLQLYDICFGPCLLWEF